jgi:predicted transcriptional regulator
MTITIELPPEAFARLLERAAREGCHAEAVAAAVLVEALEREAQDQAEVVESIRRGLEDVASGRVRPLAKFTAEQRTKHSLPELPENWHGAVDLRSR